VQAPGGRKAKGRIKQPLFSLYLLTTGKKQKASLSFRAGSVLIMNQRTVLVLRPQVTFLGQGEVGVRDRAGRVRQIRTDTAVVSALGTVFDVRIRSRSSHGRTRSRFPAGTTTVSVVSGAVVVSNRFGRQIVRAGHWTHVVPGKGPTRSTRHNARADMAWARGI